MLGEVRLRKLCLEVKECWQPAILHVMGLGRSGTLRPWLPTGEKEKGEGDGGKGRESEGKGNVLNIPLSIK